MTTELRAELTGDGKQQPVFEGLEVKAELLETLSITTITQRYLNNGKQNIEAVYTFPLPLDAVLLDMTVTLGQKTLQGTVLPKKEAEEKYEDAITDGDAPVMLQNPQPGLYTMNVGNLLPGEKASIIIRYGMFSTWQGDTLRYHLPTTIAPRYGCAEKGDLEIQQKPETSILIDNQYSFRMALYGRLAGMAIESPSHEVEIERSEDGRESRVGLAKKSAYMDRDLIILVRKQETQTTSAVMTKDGDSWMVWGCFQPRFDIPGDQSPRSIKIVVDCSGSMKGDSIAQAREALLRILDELRPQDWFNIVAFGSNATPLFNAQVRVTSESLAFARGFLKKLDADMGGTEIGKALEMANRLRCPERLNHDVLLITDGEIWEWERVIKKVGRFDHRFFTVGVGSSVSEAFVRTLAEKTGGSCELVSPNEKMAERIHRHFRRISTPYTTAATTIWSANPQRQFPDPVPRIYDGDTINLFGWFDHQHEGNVTLEISLSEVETNTLTAVIAAAGGLSSDLPRMAAALRLKQITEQKEGEKLALQYQLMSRWTNYLAIFQREDGQKTDALPELHKVPQMLAAGWGGVGTVQNAARGRSSASASVSCSYSASINVPTFLRDEQKVFSSDFNASSATCDYDFNLSPHNSANKNSYVAPLIWAWDIEDKDDIIKFIEILELTLASGTMPTMKQLLLLPAEISLRLHKLVDDGIEEYIVICHFLKIFIDSRIGKTLSRQSKRVINKTHKSTKVAQEEKSKIEQIFSIWHDTP